MKVALLGQVGFAEYAAPKISPLKPAVALKGAVSSLTRDIVPEKRIIFTTVLTEGWKPIDPWLAMTAIITMEDADKGTKYTAQALHKNPEDSNKHLEMGFEEGWGTTIDQLEKLTMKLA